MATANGGFNDSGAALSPPGAGSQRTDMGTQGAMDLPDAGYGEQAEFQDIQGGAPMAGGMPAPTGMFDGTQKPGVPVTDGAEYGPGVGLDAVKPPEVGGQDIALIAQYLPAFEQMAQRGDTPEGFRQFVRYIRGLA